ncbi:MAG: 16S rRNA (cytidine(1402)-2'-O)-methyltransferase [Flavobacteriales bacterium]|nr:16S rRNA (cytidine(1402)-2'-O)-methyltransferase [Flavobacteriales bacterium]
MLKGKLTLVPTPIGNLGDITIRAMDVLKSSDLVLAEDTRTTGKLLSLLNIKNTLVSMHKFNEHKKLESIMQMFLEGKQIAYCSDAGTPGISDPGFLLVRECHRNNIDVEALPGATALIPALVVSGLPAERFVFEGFLPLKKGLQTRMEELAGEKRTMIFYESPFRLHKTLLNFIKYFGPEREACVCREISKKFEEHIRGDLNTLSDYFAQNSPKGEIVLVVSGRTEK